MSNCATNRTPEEFPVPPGLVRVGPDAFDVPVIIRHHDTAAPRRSSSPALLQPWDGDPVTWTIGRNRVEWGGSYPGVDQGCGPGGEGEEMI